MPPSLLSRVAAPIVLLTGLLIIVAELLLLATYDPLDRIQTLRDPVYRVGGVLYFVAFGGLLLTLMATYERQAARAGRLGLAGFVAAVVGTLFLGGDLWFETFAVPWLGEVAPAAFDEVGGMVMIGGFTSYVLFAVGWALFGLASLRARVFPAAISLALVVGGVIGFQALLPPFGIPLGLALVALGAWLGRERMPLAGRAGALAAGALTLISVVAVGCGTLTGINGQGPVTTDTRDLDPFTSIEAGFGIAVTVRIGEAAPIEVRAQPNLVPIIVTTVEGGTLRITGSNEFTAGEPVEVAIVIPELRGLALSGGSRGSVSGLAAGPLELHLGGGANVAVSGTAASVSLESSGGSKADLGGLVSRTVDLDLSGGSSATVNASEEASGSVSGGSHATVTGGGRVSVTSSGGGAVVSE